MENRQYTVDEWIEIREEAIADEGPTYFLIKGNLPDTWKKYHSGNGEGIWFAVDQETKEKLDQDKTGGDFYALLTQGSVYHPQLNGELFNPNIPKTRPLLLEFRGAFRPVLARSELEALIGRETEAQSEE
ncbi:hypothetical protein HY495_00550 [Candidatus Woesearchaeota archaeon]|nr:hypothetical protein [Candidatus Woesearchaeota archaeon]